MAFDVSAHDLTFPTLEEIYADPNKPRRWWMLRASIDGWDPLPDGEAWQYLPIAAQLFVEGTPPGNNPQTWRFYAALWDDEELELALIDEIQFLRDQPIVQGFAAAPPLPGGSVTDRVPSWLAHGRDVGIANADALAVRGGYIAPYDSTLRFAALAVAARTLYLEWQGERHDLFARMRRWQQGEDPPSVFELTPEPLRTVDLGDLLRLRPSGAPPHAPHLTPTQHVYLAKESEGAPVDVVMVAQPVQAPEQLSVYVYRTRDVNTALTFRMYERFQPTDIGQQADALIEEFRLEAGQDTLGFTVPLHEDPWDFTFGRVEIDVEPSPSA